jgi:glucokinase
MAEPLFLLADVGGTNTRVALSDGVRLRTDSLRRFVNAEHANIAPVLRRYLDQTGARPSGVCIAVAGPVTAQSGALTNLPWSISCAELAAVTGAQRAAILNDLQAQGHALPHIAPADLTCLLEGPRQPQSAKLVINVGTGFNTAFVLPDATGGRSVPPSESGHSSLPCRTPRDWALSRFVGRDDGFASVEDVLSGRGLERVYAFTGQDLGISVKPAARIMADLQTDPVARQAVAQFIKILGTVAGDLSLVHLPHGGIYLMGGVARAVAVHCAADGFAAAFRDKGRFSGFMERFAVHLVTDDYAGLRGCAGYLRQLTA